MVTSPAKETGYHQASGTSRTSQVMSWSVIVRAVGLHALINSGLPIRSGFPSHS
jgi:hypothetical protein